MKKVIFYYSNGKPYHATNVVDAFEEGDVFYYRRWNKHTQLMESYEIPINASLSGVAVKEGHVVSFFRYSRKAPLMMLPTT